MRGNNWKTVASAKAGLDALESSPQCKHVHSIINLLWPWNTDTTSTSTSNSVAVFLLIFHVSTQRTEHEVGNMIRNTPDSRKRDGYQYCNDQ